METKTKCTNGQEHKKEYHSTLDGKTYYCCWMCGYVEFQFEDAGHGG